MGKSLGDYVESALSKLGITSERVEAWIGLPCGCEERKQRLNQLSNWAWRILQGRLDNAEKYLNEIMER